jgi:hypothetical protein
MSRIRTAPETARSSREGSRRARGQAITELVVVLPLVVFFFLGLTYLKKMTSMRMRAIEAARYVSWQGVWYVRKPYALTASTPIEGDIKTAAELKTGLGKVGLGGGLVDVQAVRNTTLGDYVSKFGGTPVNFTPMLQPIPSLTGIKNVIAAQLPTAQLQELANLTGDLDYALQDLFARQTKWTDEADNTIYTAKVTYGFGGANFFKKMGQIKIVQFSSTLSHPYNLDRVDAAVPGDVNQSEYNEMFGPPGSFDCGKSDGHIFDLWAFPSGPITNGSFGSGLSTALSGIKCVLSDLGKTMKFVPLANLDYKLPDGNLKEYPELHINDD